MTEVTFEWANHSVTVESFKNADDVFAYIDELKKDGVECDDFHSNNGDWCF